VSLERTLEAQRVRLLRLLTGWFAVVALLSAGPLAVPLPRWVRAVIADLLIRAELAAHYMVQVSARLQAQGDFAGLAGCDAAPAPTEMTLDDVPSTAAILRRMRALRRLLSDLPRYGQRLLRRVLCGVSGRVAPLAGPAGAVANPVAPQWNAPLGERPPDKDRHGFREFCARVFSRREALAFAVSPRSVFREAIA